jgi:Fe-S-cluster containining protein
MGDDSSPVYVTLAHARAIECNGCGDCCDSRRTDGYWTWGALPRDQFAALNDGAPLIIPLERIDGGWRDRAPTPEDESELFPTPFRCTAFRPQPDGRGLCAHHDRERPDRCGEYPVHVPYLEGELAEFGEVPLGTSTFPRCSWYRMVVVRDGDPRATAVVAAIGEPPPLEGAR